MNAVWLTIACIGAVAWIVLVFLRGSFWRMAEALAPSVSPESWPSVAIIVPARDEAAVLPETLPSLLAQDYAGSIRVVLVDDESSDGTSRIARTIARDHANGGRLTVQAGQRVPQGWRGKVWAMAQGVTAIERDEPDYLLFTDADIQHGSGVVRSLVARAKSHGLDMVSVMARLRIEGPWDRLLVPAFVYFFAKLFPFRWVADPKRRTAAAAGGCVLIQFAALRRAGGLEAIASAVIDDCSLAACLKAAGSRLWLGFDPGVRSVRIYRTLRSSWEMVARSAYAQLNYSPLLLVLTILGMLLIYLAPPLLALAGLVGAIRGPLRLPVFAASALALLLMFVSYVPTLRQYRLPKWRAATLPVAAWLYTAMTFSSAWRAWRKRETLWKERGTPKI